MNQIKPGVPALKEYDYIISGAGCAGLSLLMRMIASKQFSRKNILLVDKDRKIKNDRTWCFWDAGDHFFDSIVYKQWEKISIRSKNFTKEFDIRPYQYKMIRGIDFYRHCFSVIEQHANITIHYGSVESVESDTNGAWLNLNAELIHASYIFNSILPLQWHAKPSDIFLQQHFEGWVIETAADAFDESVAVLMDFNVDQQYGTAFIYIMPFSKKNALIEFTFFSESVLSPHIYEQGLIDYLQKFLQGNTYTITAKEKGVIPMTNYNFPAQEGNIVNMGTAGGQTKASSGYTFQFIQKRTAAIVEKMISDGHPFTKKGLTPRRFQFYDSVLLNLLLKKKPGGDIIFSKLFQHNEVQKIFKFLDNETSFAEDVNIISKLPVIPFTKAAIARLLRSNRF